MMKQGDLRKVAAASGVSTRGEDGSPLNHLVDVSTHQKLLQPSASHPASVLEHEVADKSSERRGICGLQMSTTQKRPAADLIVETPAKVKAGKWNNA